VHLVNTAYSAGAWSEFAVAVAGAAAALTGLLFIAMSINLAQILDLPGLPSRAAQTLILFGTPLVAALLLVVPDQARLALGLELLVAGLVLGVVQLLLYLRTEHADEETLWRRLLGRVFPSMISCGCLVVAGGSLMSEAGGGLYWLVPSVLAAVIFGLINVWVLLVEILR
jgi:hypothetical protein